MTEAIAAVKPQSLVRKLANVMGASERVPKTGFNTFHKYHYATESDITAAVRAEMAMQGVIMLPNVEQVDWEVVETRGGAKERFCTVHMLFTLLDADSDARIEFRNIGQGQDGGDKAFYKAVTGATKYALLKLFLLPTGDDPEAESPDAKEIKQSPKSSTPQTSAQMEQALKASIERESAKKKMISTFAEIGITVAQLEARIGHPLASLTNDEWSQLLVWGKETREKTAEAKKAFDGAPFDPEEAAREEVRKQADESFAQAAAKPKTFAQLIDELRAAPSTEAVLLIGASFPLYEKSLTKGDLAALRRQYADRLLILQDKAGESKRKLKIQDQSNDVPI